MSLMCRLVSTRSRLVWGRRSRPVHCGLKLKEAAAPEFKEFEVYAKSSLHQRLCLFICTLVSADRLPGKVSLQLVRLSATVGPVIS